MEYDFVFSNERTHHSEEYSETNNSEKESNSTENEQELKKKFKEMKMEKRREYLNSKKGEKPIEKKEKKRQSFPQYFEYDNKFDLSSARVLIAPIFQVSKELVQFKNKVHKDMELLKRKMKKFENSQCVTTIKKIMK